MLINDTNEIYWIIGIISASITVAVITFIILLKGLRDMNKGVLDS